MQEENRTSTAGNVRERLLLGAASHAFRKSLFYFRQVRKLFWLKKNPNKMKIFILSDILNAKMPWAKRLPGADSAVPCCAGDGEEASALGSVGFPPLM